MLRLEEANKPKASSSHKTTMASPSHNSATTIKFLCSYGGKIIPRYPDGKLCYHGGQTRLLSVNRSLSFSELLVKLCELCGSSSNVSLRCQLPTEDLDALVSIKSDEDLINLLEEYDRESTHQSKSLKIKAFLSFPKKISPSTSTGYGYGYGYGYGSSCSASTITHEGGSPKSTLSSVARYPVSSLNRCIYHVAKPPVQFPVRLNKSAGKAPCYSRSYLVHNGNHWQ